MIIVSCFKCTYCDFIYEVQADCKACEEYHVDYDHLQIVDAKYANYESGVQFPTRIRVEFEDPDGTSAEYELIRHGSAEGFADMNKSINE